MRWLDDSLGVRSYGVESTSSSKIQKVDLVRGSTGQSWTLTGVSGMEAMTFTTDQIDVYVLDTNPSNPDIAYQKSYAPPTVDDDTGHPTNVNFEGIAFNGQTIYLARDHGSADGSVYEFDNTLMYPQTVLPPLSW